MLYVYLIYTLTILYLCYIYTISMPYLCFIYVLSMFYLCFKYALSMFQICYKSEVIVRLMWSGMREECEWKEVAEQSRKVSMWLMLTGRRYKTCLTRNTSGCSAKCKNISVRSMPCLSRNAEGFRSDTRNMMAVTLGIMPSGSSLFWASSSSPLP